MPQPSILRTGTAGGTLTILLTQLHSGDVVKTMILAAVGAAVSFVVSFLLKKLVERWKSPRV